MNSATNTFSNATVTIGANTAQFFTATFPAQTTGTWLTTNALGARLRFNLAYSGSINIAATVGNTFELTGLLVLPGIEAPSANRAPFIMRPYDQSLSLCKRYLHRRSFAASQYIATLQAVNATLAVGPLYTFPEMCSLPQPTVSAVGNFSAQAAGGGGAAFSAITFSSYKDQLSISSGTTAGLASGNATQMYAAVPAWIQLDARL
jgi:hypothetical protein